VTQKGVQKAFDERFAVEAKKHLGIDVDPADVDPNQILRKFRAKGRQTIPPEVLRREFTRLTYNRRTLWVAPREKATAKHLFLLRDGVIEMRSPTGRAVAFALLEPHRAMGFYAKIAYHRRPPDLRVLDRLYNATDRSQQDRKTIGETIRNETAGAGKFAAAYLLKEAFKGRNALGDLRTPGFWGSLSAFTVAARGAEKLLPFKNVLPLAGGMAAVQLLSGNFSLRDLAISTGSFVAAGAAINLFADGWIYPMLFAAGPPGWAAAGAYTVGKLAVTLYAGEKLEEWIRSRLDRSQETRSEGVRQKIDRLLPGTP